MSDKIIVILAFFVATFLVFSANPTGNYVSNYNPASISKDTVGSCVGQPADKMDCFYDANSGWWTTKCINGRWTKQEFCGTLTQYGDRSCVRRMIDYRTSKTECQSPYLPEENKDYGTQRGSIVYSY